MECVAALWILVVDPLESWRFLLFVEAAVFERERFLVGTVSVCDGGKSGRLLALQSWIAWLKYFMACGMIS